MSASVDATTLHALLISTYELGRQPFGLASPAAWLQREGVVVVTLDLTQQRLDEEAVCQADLIAFYLPMHTATRLAVPLMRRILTLHPRVHLCAYGLYALANADYLYQVGVQTVIGGEYEATLAELARSLAVRRLGLNTDSGELSPQRDLPRLRFLTPDRRPLPVLGRYATLQQGSAQPRTVGYTEATRGCLHHCTHCPIPPVYNGALRVVQAEVVLADIAQQVEAGAEHITFGDPDFFNGPGHALRIVQELHRRWPQLTFDATIKVEHLLRYAVHLGTLKACGCMLITSAVEAIDERILQRFKKHHTRDDIVKAVALLREHQIALNATFVPFTPWTTLQGYCDLLEFIACHDLVANVAPIQYAIRLLLPAGSLLLQQPEIQAVIAAFDQEALCYPWVHPDPRLDALYEEVRAIVSDAENSIGREGLFERVVACAERATGSRISYQERIGAARAPIPHLSEPWYC